MPTPEIPASTKPIQTTSEIPIAPLYTAASTLNPELGLPGEFPYTRGIQPHMYRSRLWTMRQYAGMGDAEASNQRYKFLLANGTSGLSVAFDLPTQIGFDSDAPQSLGEVGRVGVAIDSIDDVTTLFAGIPLDRISTSMTINATASILLALYIAVAKRTGADPKNLQGTIQNDILKEYIARGTYIYPVPHAMRLVTDIFRYAYTELPQWNTISISGYHMREAGCTAVQEIAFTLANGIAYVQSAIDAGLDVDAFAPRLSFFFNAHSNLFEEAAKFRAARRMWAHLMRERFAAKNPKSWQLRFHTQTAGSTLTALQPENNTVRTTLQALSAVLGGTQSLHTNGFDEALALPTEQAARLALRAQQILAHESGVAQTVDPLAGSYFVETLTNELEARATAYLDRIAQFNPASPNLAVLAAIEQGFLQREIQNAAYAYQSAVESGEAIVVGVNRFQGDQTDVEVPIQRIDPELEPRQVARTRALRQRRNPATWASAIAAVKESARTGSNLMPHILQAVEAEATVGEIADTLRAVFGEYRETVVI
jgi:methylmalonyl-CoA mutase N-terminal domain/subunit